MSEATFYLFKALLDIFSIGIILNFLFRLLKADYFNPIVQGFVKAFDFPGQLVRNLIRPVMSVDIASLIVVFLVQSSAFYLAAMAGSIEYEPVKILIWSCYSVTLLLLKIIWWVMIGGIILSWVAGSSPQPAVRILQQMSDAIFRPFRVFLPPMGGLDFSPILAFIALNFLQIAIQRFAIDSGLPFGLSIGF